ncbi:MAG: DUF4340 domain-containing protein [Clostridia bacterium]|nr:DUF4340 domain-containing protein [Clostridia bacterium]
MRRQKTLVIVCAVLFAVLLAAYFFVITPYIKANTPEVENTAPETEAGEMVGISDRIYIFRDIKASEIAKISVENQSGSFAFVSSGDGKFYIEGHKNIPFDEESFALLQTVTASTLSKTKVVSGASDEKLDEYGLLHPQANWVVETTGGEFFKVYVGDALLTGGGYYCMFEGRPGSVYVLSEDVSKTILTTIEGYVTPIICAGISQDDYYTVDKFTVYKNGEKLLRIRLVDKELQNNKEALAENIMDYPTSYYPNTQIYYEIIYQFMGLVADRCYDISATDEEKAAIGMDDPATVITFEYNKFLYELYFSEAQEDGTYYASSNMFPNVIGVCSADTVKFLEYELIDWVDKLVFQQYITKISSINVKSDDVTADFQLSHGVSEDGKNTPLYVKADGKDLTTEQVANFRQFYKSLLSVTITDYCIDDEYCKMTEDELKAFISDKSNAMLLLSYTTIDGQTSELGFYPYSNRHSCVTIDGVGDFYVSTDYVKKLINDTVRLLNDEAIDANGKY